MEQTPFLWISAALAAFLIYKFVKGYRSPQVLQQMATALSSGGKLIDVRTPGEFVGGHHPRALNIPLTDLVESVDRVGPKESPVVLYCRSGSRSATATRILKNAGYLQVMDLGPYRNIHKLPAIEVKTPVQGRIPKGKKRRSKRR